MFLFSGPSNIWEAILMLSIVMLVPMLIVLVISHSIIKSTRFYLEKINDFIVGKIVYWLLLFVISFFICFLGFVILEEI